MLDNSRLTSNPNQLMATDVFDLDERQEGPGVNEVQSKRSKVKNLI